MIAFIGFILVFYGTLYVIGTVWSWLRNGFNFDRVRAENAFINEQLEEERARKKRENERLVQEWKAKRMERLGY